MTDFILFLLSPLSFFVFLSFVTNLPFFLWYLLYHFPFLFLRHQHPRVEEPPHRRNTVTTTHRTTSMSHHIVMTTSAPTPNELTTVTPMQPLVTLNEDNDGRREHQSAMILPLQTQHTILEFLIFFHRHSSFSPFTHLKHVHRQQWQQGIFETRSFLPCSPYSQ